MDIVALKHHPGHEMYARSFKCPSVIIFVISIVECLILAIINGYGAIFSPRIHLRLLSIEIRRFWCYKFRKNQGFFFL